MPNFCIISEFNPLHNGHKYLISKARELGAETITCIMSGNSTQRGELAITDKYLRARAAIEVGADLVLELPFPWCSSSAEYFANAAIYIAQYFGDTLFFGSECGDITELLKSADYCETQKFYIEYENLLKNGNGAAFSYVECLKNNGFKEFLSNDILGISYIRAINRFGASMRPLTVKREGSNYNDISTQSGIFPSATAMRCMIEKGNIEGLSGFMPVEMQHIIDIEQKCGRITEISETDSAVLTYFRLTDAELFGGVAETQGGVANRLINASRKSVTVKEMLENAKTKRYTDAKLRRAMLFCITHTKQEIMKKLPEYTTLLAANERGRALLAKNRHDDGISVITKPADAKRDTEQFILTERLDAFYTVARKNKLPADFFFQKTAYVVK